MDHNHDCNHTNCTTSIANKSVHQTLSEMDWERGVWSAAFNGDIKRVQFLINKARNIKELINAPDNAGYSALHYAARNGHIDVCKILLENGAYIDAQTKSGKATPLHKAAAAGKVETVKLLIQLGASVVMQDIDGQTCLHKAVENNYPDLISHLIETYPQLSHIKDKKGNLAIKSVYTTK